MRCSIIIPTCNRALSLQRTLESVLPQAGRHDDVEVLVIDNASSDETARVVARSDSVRYLFEKEPGLHNGRHKGLRESRGDLLCFLDDDVVVLPGWLDGVLDVFRDEKVVLAGGRIVPRFESDPPGW